MLQFLPNAPSSFFLGNERCPFANDSIFWVNSVQRLDQTSWQTFGSQISLNDSFSSLPHVLSRLKRFTQSCNRKVKNIKSVEHSCARPVPGGMPLPRHNCYLYFHYIYACRNTSYICLHVAERTEENLSMCTCFVLFRCSVTLAGHVRGFYSYLCQRFNT